MWIKAKRLPLLSQLLLIALTVGVWGLLFAPYFSGSPAQAQHSKSPSSVDFDTINVKRINVVDSTGTTRLAIANSDHFPDATYRGKTYKRSIGDGVGMVFFEEDGDEAGGIGLAKLGDKNQSAFIFDYTHQITDGVGMFKREGKSGEGWEAGFFVSDRRAFEPGDVVSSQGVERISLRNADKDANLVISDPAGRPRVWIGVNRNGRPLIQMLDERGNVVFDAGKDMLAN